MSLEIEIRTSALEIATDAYDMSVGELINIYRDGELLVSPEFQRLFRWNKFQKSHLIESLLIGVPIPSIFVFELEDGRWELIDGLQRISTILEFVGILKGPDGVMYSPSVMEGTRYLPSLMGASWDGIPADSASIGSAQQITIKRARVSVQILRKNSDEKAKYDLFQRLNSHGSNATPQELRNCILHMLNRNMFVRMREISKDPRFIRIIQPSERSSETQASLDFLTRYLVFVFVEYDKGWDIEEYLDNGIIELSKDPPEIIDNVLNDFVSTLEVIDEVGEPNILKRFKDGKFSGKVGQAGFETIFLGISFNLFELKSKDDRAQFILNRAKQLWQREDVQNFTKAGLRGTDRIQRTLEFGREWFKP